MPVAHKYIGKYPSVMHLPLQTGVKGKGRKNSCPKILTGLQRHLESESVKKVLIQLIRGKSAFPLNFGKKSGDPVKGGINKGWKKLLLSSEIMPESKVG